MRHKECKVKLKNGEVFVSRILKIEPEGVTFKKPVTVLLSHSLDEDQDFLYFYELIVENFSSVGYQEFKTEAISSIQGIHISNNVVEKIESRNFQCKSTMVNAWFVLLYQQSLFVLRMQQKITACMCD